MEPRAEDFLNYIATKNQKKSFKLVVAGLPGAGKSTVLNAIAGKKDLFPAGSTVTSVTAAIDRKTSRLFGRSDYPEMELYDVPGIGDPQKVKIPEVLGMMNSGLKDISFDYVLWVRKVTDYRWTIGDEIVLGILNGCIKSLESFQYGLVITHCELGDKQIKKFDENIADLKKIVEEKGYRFPDKIYRFKEDAITENFGLMQKDNNLIEAVTGNTKKVETKNFSKEDCEKVIVSSTGGGSCIDWNSRAYCLLKDGTDEARLLRSLQVGDMIMVDVCLGRPRFEPILILNKHPEEKIVLKLEIESSHTISVVFDQIMLVQRTNIPQFVVSSDIRVADSLAIIDEENKQVVWKRVVKISLGFVDGVAHIWTPSYQYFAEGVLCSSHVKSTVQFGSMPGCLLSLMWAQNKKLPQLLNSLIRNVRDITKWFD